MTMTGEMSREEVTPEAYPLHFAVAESLNGTVHPFDQYQGPFVQTKHGRLWITSEDGWVFRVYNERTDKMSDYWPIFRDNEINKEMAVEHAKEVI